MYCARQRGKGHGANARRGGTHQTNTPKKTTTPPSPSVRQRRAATRVSVIRLATAVLPPRAAQMRTRKRGVHRPSEPASRPRQAGRQANSVHNDNACGVPPTPAAPPLPLPARPQRPHVPRRTPPFVPAPGSPAQGWEWSGPPPHPPLPWGITKAARTPLPIAGITRPHAVRPPKQHPKASPAPAGASSEGRKAGRDERAVTRTTSHIGSLPTNDQATTGGTKEKKKKGASRPTGTTTPSSATTYALPRHDEGGDGERR